MKKKITSIFTLLITALMVNPMTAQDFPFKVIVNASNPISSMTKSQVSNLFLKKVIEWKNGIKVLPVDLVERFTVRQRFTNEIHGRKIRAVIQIAYNGNINIALGVNSDITSFRMPGRRSQIASCPEQVPISIILDSGKIIVGILRRSIITAATCHIDITGGINRGIESSIIPT